MISQEQGIIVFKVSAIKQFQFPNLFYYIVSGPGLKSVSRFHATELAVIQTPVCNIKWYYLIVHMARIRREDRKPPTYDLI